MATSGASLAIRAAALFDGTRTRDGLWDVLIEGGRIAFVGAAGASPGFAGIPIVDGGFVMPGIVDAHVHLSFSTPLAVARGGVTGVLDLGEPLDAAFLPQPPLRYRAAGPILTAPRGYPTQSWGAGGFGFEVATPQDARRAVADLAERGAAIIKVALQGEPALNEATLAAIVAAAGEAGLSIAVHALTRDAVERAVDAGADTLAHTPVERLGDAVVAECGRRSMTVISTIRAFGDSAHTRDNLTGLAAAGCRIAYGTDLGNDGISPGADAAELSILAGILGGRDAALVAATTTSSDVAGIPAASIEPGAVANLLVCSSDAFDSIARPVHVIIDGRIADTEDDR